MVFVLAACGDDSDDSDDAGNDDEEVEESADESAAPDPCAIDDVSYVATANVNAEGSISVYDAPDGASFAEVDPVMRSDAEGNQAPASFLIDADATEGDPGDAEWLSVELPISDGDGVGYIQNDDSVAVSCHGFRVTVDRASFTLTVTNEGESVFEAEVGLGRDDRATQEGHFFVTDLYRVENPDGAYGPYAFALNSFSDDPDVIADFGEDAQAGIHGTNEPESLGSAVSSGCIRMSNENIATLANDAELMPEGTEPVPLPLGTPVDVR
jgi:hypothetical protein